MTTDKSEIDDWIKCMIEDENKFRKFYSVENKNVNIYIFFISNGKEVLYVEKNKVELIDGLLMWDRLEEVITKYKKYKGSKYTNPKIGVYNIDINDKAEVVDFISSISDNDNDNNDNNDNKEDEMFKYWRFVKPNKDIRFKDSVEMFGRLNAVYMFFNEDII